MPRVLLIDDEPIYFKMVERALKGHRFDVFYAKDGLDGLRNVSVANPDVVILVCDAAKERHDQRPAILHIADDVLGILRRHLIQVGDDHQLVAAQIA